MNQFTFIIYILENHSCQKDTYEIIRFLKSRFPFDCTDQLKQINIKLFVGQASGIEKRRREHTPAEWKWHIYE